MLGPCTHMVVQEEAPGSWLRISAVRRPQRTGCGGHWRVNQRQKEDLSLCLSLTVHSACQEKIIIIIITGDGAGILTHG